MARFSPRRLHFGNRPDLDTEDGGEGLPLPLRVKLAARRAAGIREAKETLAHLPGPGESLHAIMTARLDMSDVLNALLSLAYSLLARGVEYEVQPICVENQIGLLCYSPLAQGLLGGRYSTEHRPGGLDQNVLKLVDRADVMIYDSTYTDEEYPTRRGWGPDGRSRTGTSTGWRPATPQKRTRPC